MKGQITRPYKSEETSIGQQEEIEDIELSFEIYDVIEGYSKEDYIDKETFSSNHAIFSTWYVHKRPIYEEEEEMLDEEALVVPNKSAVYFEVETDASLCAKIIE